jgi:hypothetical protein
MDIKREIAPSTSRVGIAVSDCKCFDSAEEATRWMQLLTGSWLEDPVFTAISPDIGKTIELKPGEERKITLYCYSMDQIFKHHAKVTSPRSGGKGDR